MDLSLATGLSFADLAGLDDEVIVTYRQQILERAARRG